MNSSSSSKTQMQDTMDMESTASSLLSEYDSYGTVSPNDDADDDTHIFEALSQQAHWQQQSVHASALEKWGAEYGAGKYVGGGVFSTEPLFIHDGRSFVIGTDHVFKVYHTDTGNLMSSIGISSLLSLTGSASIVAISRHPANKFRETHILMLLDTGSLLVWNLSKQALAHYGNSLRPQQVYVLHVPASLNSKGVQMSGMTVCKYEETPHSTVVALFIRCGATVVRGTLLVEHSAADKLLPVTNTAVKCIPVMTTHDPNIVDMQVSQNHSHLSIITSRQWMVLDVSDVDDMRICFRKQISGKTLLFTRVALSCRNMVAAGDSDGHIYLCSMSEKNPQQQEFIWNWHSSQIHTLAFSNDGNYLYSAADEGILITWDIGYNMGSKTFTHCHAPITAIAISNAQDRYVTVSSHNFVLVIDPAQQTPLCKISGINRTPPAPLSTKDLVQHQQQSLDQTDFIMDPANPQRIVVINRSHVIQWFDVLNERSVQEESVHFRSLTQNPSRFSDLNPLHHRIVKAAFSRCGEFMAHGEVQIDSDETTQHLVRFWRKNATENRKGLFDVLSVADQAHDGPISCIVFHPIVPQICVTCSQDGSAKLWTLNNNFFICSAVLRWRGGLVPSLSATFSNDGSILMVSYGETITMWNVSKMMCIAEISPDSSKIQQMATLSDDSLLLVRTALGNVHIVSLLTMQPVQSICSSANMKMVGDVAVHKSSKQFASIMIEITRSDAILWHVAVFGEQEGVKHLIPVPTRPIAVHWLGDGEHLWMLNSSMEFFQLSIHRDPARAVQQPASLDGHMVAVDHLEEKSGIQDFDSDTWVRNVRQSLSKLAFQQIEKLKQQEHQTHSFDPDSGVGAWKRLFNASSHSLVSTNSVYTSFMDTLLLKRQKSDSMIDSRTNSTVGVTDIRQQGKVDTEKMKSSRISVDRMKKEEEADNNAEMKKAGRRAARLPVELAEFLTQFAKSSI